MSRYRDKESFAHASRLPVRRFESVDLSEDSRNSIPLLLEINLSVTIKEVITLEVLKPIKRQEGIGSLRRTIQVSFLNLLCFSLGHNELRLVVKTKIQGTDPTLELLFYTNLR